MSFAVAKIPWRMGFVYLLSNDCIYVRVWLKIRLSRFVVREFKNIFLKILILLVLLLVKANHLIFRDWFLD